MILDNKTKRIEKCDIVGEYKINGIPNLFLSYDLLISYGLTGFQSTIYLQITLIKFLLYFILHITKTSEISMNFSLTFIPRQRKSSFIFLI